MNRFVLPVITIIALSAVGYFVMDKYYPENLTWLKDVLPKQVVSTTESDAMTELTATVNIDLDSRLAAVFKDSSTGSGVAVFTEMSEGTEFIKQLVLKGTGEGGALIKVNERAQPTSLEHNGYLLLFDDYTSDTVDLTVRKPDRTYETAKDVPLIGIETHKPEVGLSRWDNLQQNDDSDYRNYLYDSVVAILDIVGCTALKSSLLPETTPDDALAFVGCSTTVISAKSDSTVIEPCTVSPLECGMQVITHLETLKESAVMNAQSDDYADEQALRELSLVDRLLLEESDKPSPDITEQEAVFDLMSHIDATGTLVASFSQRTTNDQGLTETDEGVVSISFSGSEGTCKMAAKSTTTGTPTVPPDSPPDTLLPPVSIATTATSSICTGEINAETGQFELEGVAQTNTAAQTGRLNQVTTSGVGAFHILGLIQEGTVTGTIFYANKAIELVPQQ